jgi:adenylosuccinate lyase
VSEKEFPLTLDQLNSLIKNPADFSGNSLQQTETVKKTIASKIKRKVSKVELGDLR